LNKGTKEGTHEEINLVCNINKGLFNTFLKANFPQCKNVYSIHVTQHKLSKISERKVKPKSDAFLVDFKRDITPFLIHNYYLNEENVQEVIKKSGEKYVVIENSGISIKRPDSLRYQIHKFTPTSFLKVFNNKYLGAGAMIYSKNKNDLQKNKQIIEKFWKISEEDFFSYFYKVLIFLNNNLSVQEKYQKISKYCLSEIKRRILENVNIKESVFTGKNDFEEPFGATFSFMHNKLEKFKYTNFFVSQGSKRLTTHAIVIKPKT